MEGGFGGMVRFNKLYLGAVGDPSATLEDVDLRISTVQRTCGIRIARQTTALLRLPNRHVFQRSVCVTRKFTSDYATICKVRV